MREANEGEGEKKEGKRDRDREMEKGNTITKTSIQIDQALWDKFKDSLPKTKTMSEGIEDLIREKFGGKEDGK